MNKLGILLLTTAASVAVMMVGCGDDTSTTGSTSTTSTTSSTSGSGGGGTGGGTGTGGAGGGGNTDLGNMPKYGAQIDRFGRPAVNTAANATFETDMAKQGMAKDAWNTDADVANWGKNHGPEVAKNLAILDALDGNCGNQLLAGKMLNADRYKTLAGVLADDRQWLNTDGKTCTAYLAVEANATGIMANSDCGGRALSYDVIDASYSLLAIGMPSGVTDGIATPDYAKGATFPYLATPK